MTENIKEKNGNNSLVQETLEQWKNEICTAPDLGEPLKT